MIRRRWVTVALALSCAAWIGAIPRSANAQEEPGPSQGPSGPQGGPDFRPPGPQGRGPDTRGGGPEHLFEVLDANHDGVVTETEVQRFARERFTRALADADANHDGKLTESEFLRASIHSPPPGDPRGGGDGGADRPHSKVEIFKAFDQNGDGKLRASEVPEPHRTNILGLLGKLGRGPDGYLTRKDFEQIDDSSGPDGPPSGPERGGPRGRGGPDGGGPGDQDQQRPDPAEIFRMVDRNRDGVVSRSEAAVAPPGPRAGMVKLLEQSGKKSITKDQFLEMVNPTPTAPRSGAESQTPLTPDNRPDVEALFARYDKNHDGRLKIEEVDGPEQEVIRAILNQRKLVETGITKRELKFVFGDPSVRNEAPSTTPAPQPPASAPASTPPAAPH